MFIAFLIVLIAGTLGGIVGAFTYRWINDGRCAYCGEYHCKDIDDEDEDVDDAFA